MRKGNGLRIRLSPRGAATSAELATRFGDVDLCRDNQAVIDESDVVLACIRPQGADAVLRPLSFRTGQTVISAVAGLRLSTLEPLVAPATACRAIPLPALAQGAGVTPVFPPNASARALFERLGGVAEVADEARFDAFSAATATIAAHIAYLNAVSSWLVAHGIDRDAANGYVAGTFAGLDLTMARGVTLGDLARHHATPGGINDAFALDLTTAGFLDAVRIGLDRTLERLNDRG